MANSCFDRKKDATFFSSYKPKGSHQVRLFVSTTTYLSPLNQNVK